MRKYNIDILKKYALNKRGKLLSDEYFGMLHKYKWMCMSGHTWITSASSIINSETWCKECNKKHIGNVLRRKNGVEYLHELANKKGGKCNSVEYINNHSKYEWICSEGHMWTATAHHIKSGTWCPICRKESKGENIIANVLIDNDIKYIPQYKFDDCIGLGGKKLLFDFYLPDFNTCIEYNGEQHYVYREIGNYTNKLEKTQIHDKIKFEFCKKQNIKLLVIPYGFFKYLKELIQNFINVKFKNEFNCKKTIAIFCGSRPEIIKCKPLINELNKHLIPNLVVLTGQQKDLLKHEKHDFKFQLRNDIGMNRLCSLTYQIIGSVDRFLVKHPYVSTIVCQGDTTTALSVALASFYGKKKLIHLEAGLRTYDMCNPFPEEANRRMISCIADIHLCPTNQNLLNLENEKIGGLKFVVGNTGLDDLHSYLLKCEYTKVVLVTMHRRENHVNIDQWFENINNIAKKYFDHQFILPIHPNPDVKKHKNILTNINVVEPLPHSELLDILVKCKFVISDSGSIQEECSFFGKKIIVCRKETERPEAIGHTTQLCESPDELHEIVKDMMENYEVLDNNCPFGDGKSAKKIVKILQKEKIV